MTSLLFGPSKSHRVRPIHGRCKGKNTRTRFVTLDSISRNRTAVSAYTPGCVHTTRPHIVRIGPEARQRDGCAGGRSQVPAVVAGKDTEICDRNGWKGTRNGAIF